MREVGNRRVSGPFAWTMPVRRIDQPPKSRVRKPLRTLPHDPVISVDGAVLSRNLAEHEFFDYLFLLSHAILRPLGPI